MDVVFVVVVVVLARSQPPPSLYFLRESLTKLRIIFDNYMYYPHISRMVFIIL